MQSVVGSNDDDDDDDHDASLLVSPIGLLIVAARDNGDRQQQNAAAFAVGHERSHSITNKRTSNYDVIFHNDENGSMSSPPSSSLLVQTPAKSKFNYLEAMAELEYLAPTPATTTAHCCHDGEEEEEEEGRMQYLYERNRRGGAVGYGWRR